MLGGLEVDGFSCGAVYGRVAVCVVAWDPEKRDFVEHFEAVGQLVVLVDVRGKKNRS